MKVVNVYGNVPEGVPYDYIKVPRVPPQCMPGTHEQGVDGKQHIAVAKDYAICGVKVEPWVVWQSYPTCWLCMAITELKRE